ncbi:hypothetical protein RvY_01314 [Ramazzottius varieornatus]|uniref:Uncharacterized protein n=1 Tax=Ramazzottius varieornatus TaxID=947166 RepID=A0A1D1UQM0_RAMVA|nr:hypothetical protein RvY_01314 [Ramazzottius varieornatus]
MHTITRKVSSEKKAVSTTKFESSNRIFAKSYCNMRFLFLCVLFLVLAVAFGAPAPRKVGLQHQDSLSGDMDDRGKVCRNFTKEDMQCEECTTKSSDGTWRKETKCST